MLLKIIYLTSRCALSFLICAASFCFSTEVPLDEEPAPNPLSLSTDFFNYFEQGDEAVLKGRIQKSVDALNVMYGNLTEDTQSKTLMYFNKIALNLEALPHLKAERELLPKPRLFRENYTFDEIEALINSESQIDEREHHLEKEKAAIFLLMKKLDRHIDSQMSDYRKLDAPTEKKLLLGLEIFAHMSSYRVMQEKERLIREKMARNLNTAEDFKQEVAFAFKNLQAVSQTHLLKQLGDKEELLAMRESGSVHADLMVPTVFGESDKQIAEGYLAQGKSIQAAIAAALVNVDILVIKSKLQIMGALKGDSSAWKQKAVEIDSQRELWNSKTETDLERIGRMGFKLDDQSLKDSKDPLAALALLSYQEVQESLNMLTLLNRKLNFAENLIAFATPTSTIAGGTKKVWDDCCDQVGGYLHATLFKVANVPITLAGLIEALLILCGAYLFSYFIRLLIAHLLKEQTTFSHSNVFIFDRLLHYGILALGFMIALLTVGLELNSIFWVLGALSVGIGFGLQTIVNNFASSLILLFSRSIKVQDYIQLDSGDYGQVIDISVQNTILRTNDGIDIVIPNSQLISNKFMNWTMHDPYKRLHIPFSVAYGSNKSFVEEVVSASAQALPFTIQNHPYLEGPRVWMRALGESALDLELVVWVNMYTAKGSHGSLQSSYLWEIESALTENNITIPFPQCDIRIKPSS